MIKLNGTIITPTIFPDKTSQIWHVENILELGKWSNHIVFSPVMSDSSLDVQIKTLEGVMRPSVNDYVIKGSSGEFWFVRKAIFEDTYFEYDPNEHGISFNDN